MTKPKPKPEGHRKWKSKSYQSTPCSTDVFEDGPVHRARLNIQHQKLYRLMLADPALPGGPVVARLLSELIR